MGKKRGIIVFLVMIALSVNIVSAIDSLNEIVAPPAPPSDNEGDKNILVLELRDYNSKELIKDIHVNVELLNKQTNEQIKTLKYVGQDGRLALTVGKCPYDIVLKVDKIDTNGKDYYARFDQSIDGDSNITIYLLPVGSLIGNIFDKNSQAIKGADIKFTCSGEYGEFQGMTSDDSGGFNSDWLPIGSCRISAVHGSEMGFLDTEIKPGQLQSIELNLSRGMLSSWNMPAVIFFMILVAAILSAGFFYLFKKKIPQKADKKLDPVAEEKISSRADDILKTLGQKDRSVVEFLLKSSNKSTQAKIRYGVSMPKTSLARVLKNLETKNIINIERIGKLKAIQLTDWFLGKS